jgi:hypothetical protein
MFQAEQTECRPNRELFWCMLGIHFFLMTQGPLPTCEQRRKAYKRVCVNLGNNGKKSDFTGIDACHRVILFKLIMKPAKRSSECYSNQHSHVNRLGISQPPGLETLILLMVSDSAVIKMTGISYLPPGFFYAGCLKSSIPGSIHQEN